jgi:hypothetical protein
MELALGEARTFANNALKVVQPSRLEASRGIGGKGATRADIAGSSFSKKQATVTPSVGTRPTVLSTLFLV